MGKGKSENISPILKYLEIVNHLDQIKCKAKSVEDFLKFDVIEQAL